ncbi:SH3 domain-containing protein C23A1.17-like [Pecten maximus]|uniref:SH3 domain-containing protein C23A1.17-like n=1 Tax=Pecten maximus TaxID=6579 RepID=UPI001458F5F6|nr:SH3 domain-containing protein C23A1.17-like [Pecten maximus]
MDELPSIEQLLHDYPNDVVAEQLRELKRKLEQDKENQPPSKQLRLIDSEIYQCHVCGKKIKRLQNFRRHLAGHEKPFSCVHCNTSFTRMDNLKRHMARKHQDGGNVSTKPLHVQSPLPKPLHVRSPLPKPPHVRSPLPGPPHVRSPLPGPSHAQSPLPGPSHAQSPLPGPSHAQSPLPGPSHAQSPLPGPSHAQSPLPGPSHAQSPLPGPSHAQSPLPGPSRIQSPIPNLPQSSTRERYSPIIEPVTPPPTNNHQFSDDSSLNGSANVRSINPNDVDNADLLTFFSNIKEEVVEHITHQCHSLQGIKWYLCAQVELEKEDKDGNKQQSYPHFRTSLHPNHKVPELVTNYLPYEQELDMTGIQYPMTISQVEKFERQNNISVNVFGYEDKDIFPMYVTKLRQIKPSE